MLVRRRGERAAVRLQAEKKRADALGEGREPVCEREGLAAVAAEVAALVVLDEAEVEPRHEPAELDLRRQAERHEDIR